MNQFKVAYYPIGENKAVCFNSGSEGKYTYSNYDQGLSFSRCCHGCGVGNTLLIHALTSVTIPFIRDKAIRMDGMPKEYVVHDFCPKCFCSNLFPDYQLFTNAHGADAGTCRLLRDKVSAKMKRFK